MPDFVVNLFENSVFLNVVLKTADLVQFAAPFVGEGVFLEQELVHQNANAPDIRFLTELVFKCLGGHIFEGSNKGGNEGLIIDDFGKTVVCELNMSLIGNE